MDAENIIYFITTMSSVPERAAHALCWRTDALAPTRAPWSPAAQHTGPRPAPGVPA